MKAVQIILQALFSIYAFALFIFFLLLIFPLVLLASLYGKIRGGNFIYGISRCWAMAWLPLAGIWVRRMGLESKPEGRRYIYIANHNSYLDIPMMVRTIPLPFRALGKSEMARIPVFGYMYRCAAVMVRRDSVEDRARSVRILKSVLQKGISIFIFPEGTFNTGSQPMKSFYDGAFRIALETATPIKPVIFPDTLDRLHFRSILSLSPGVCRAVFLPEIPVEGLGLKDLPGLRQRAFEAMEAALLACRQKN
jgi:1-acyl-sn-glycerol-3-phosphate acyltransferase